MPPWLWSLVAAAREWRHFRVVRRAGGWTRVHRDGALVAILRENPA